MGDREGLEPGARGVEELRRFRLTGTPPPVVKAGVCPPRCSPPELPPPSRGMDVARSELVTI